LVDIPTKSWIIKVVTLFGTCNKWFGINIFLCIFFSFILIKRKLFKCRVLNNYCYKYLYVYILYFYIILHITNLSYFFYTIIWITHIFIILANSDINITISHTFFGWVSINILIYFSRRFWRSGWFWFIMRFFILIMEWILLIKCTINRTFSGTTFFFI